MSEERDWAPYIPILFGWDLKFRPSILFDREGS